MRMRRERRPRQHRILRQTRQSRWCAACRGTNQKRHAQKLAQKYSAGSVRQMPISHRIGLIFLMRLRSPIHLCGYRVLMSIRAVQNLC
ncbi:hypothetical protein AA18889_0703 [Acetobacter senegalensis DSM 18889]|nr:hypothetical protein AA18889_0703 [Acetobacter senegalensis DSM 18889]